MSQTKVIYIINKKETEIDLESDRTLLDGAIMHKLDPPYSCLEGACSACEARIELGDVKDHSGDDTSEDPKRVKTCQSFPKSSLVKVNYDLD